MSTIGSTPPGLGTTGFDPAGGQVSFDEARQQGLLRTDVGAPVPEAAPAPLVDSGETLLNLSAWGDAGAPRMLPRSDALASQLSQLDRAEAANTAVDGILSAL
ncbi:hypothetical protein FZO89_11070 [Luteimonas viscosa]|uniref:Uncharacterized protein n=1 Tax=Luteimonas viscosa TaxID=1132694 RepID=A0A5D4XRR0_9GAMM|nr:hypothetical protein [Luteimonas viscosa]TYT26754.1 hypothetical protein FZO89_11070 [Luteimonas viscosa]